MNIVDLTQNYDKDYFVCLEDLSSEMKESRNHKESWYKKMPHFILCVTAMLPICSNKELTLK